MQLRKLAAACPLFLALSLPATAGPLAPPAGASVRAKTMHVTKTGVFVKHLTMRSFRMTSGMHSYLVRVSPMAHVTLGGMKASVSRLKKGDHLKVTGELEMGKILATKVVATSGM